MFNQFSDVWLVVFLVFGLIGCPDDPMQAGRSALAMDNADAAEVAFKKVLAKDPDNPEAQRMMAEVLRLRGDYQGAEKRLNAIWDAKGFVNGGTPRPPEEKLLRRLMKEQYAELYDVWLDKVEPSEDPEKFISAVRRGIEKDPKNEKLNTLAVKFHFSRAERFLETGNLKGAMEDYAEALRYRAPAEQRKEIEAKMLELRKKMFFKALRAQFLTKVKPKLIEKGRWDAERNVILLSATNEFDKKINVKNEAAVQAARATSDLVIGMALMAGVETVTGIPTTKETLATFGKPKFKLENEKIKGRKISFTVLLSVEDALEYGFDLSEAIRAGTAPAKATGPTVRTVEVEVGSQGKK